MSRRSPWTTTPGRTRWLKLSYPGIMAEAHHPGRVYEVLPDDEDEGTFRVYTLDGHVPQCGHGQTKTEATRQFRLLEGIARGWQPTGEPSNLVPVPGQGGRQRNPGKTSA